MTSHTTTTVATAYSEAIPEGARPIRCQLVVVEGPDMGRGVPLEENTPVVVGSAPECGLQLTDERVSRRHLEVCAQAGLFAVRDLESTNGTLFQGALVAQTTVRPGATFKLGRTFVRIQPEPQSLEVTPSQSRRFGELVAESLVMREVFAVLELAAQSDVTVLLEGETGTGKELAARAIHDASARRRGPFVALDCGALPESLVESELFGHVRGAFTGASSSRDGAFLRAHRGTLFLDELGTVPLPVQARLLRAVEERSVRAVGADREREVDVRILAAARHNLPARVAEGRFRPDLFYRLSVVRLHLPPLRDRREDIAPITAEMMRRRGVEPGDLTSAEARANLDRLMAHGWPGNVRELRNVIDRALALNSGDRSFAALRLSLDPLSTEGALPIRTDLPFSQAKRMVVDAFEQRYLRDLLERVDGNVSAASREARLDRKHLRDLLKRHGLL